MPENFGARMRQRREERGIDLITIAKQTKIKPALLEALERDDVSHWPSGFYRRAFIRAYAHAIALDPDAVVREFVEVYPEPPEVDVVEAMASTLGLGERGARPTTTRVRNVVELAIGSLSRLRRSEADIPGSAPSPPPTATIRAQLEVRPEATCHPVRPAVPPPSPDGNARALLTPEATPPSAAATAPTAPPVEFLSDAPSDRLPAKPQPSSETDLLAVAHLCTEFALVGDADEVPPLLQRAAKLLNATGLIVWLWDASAAALKPALVHGYSHRTIAQLPPVRRDADNATALGFRSAQVCAIAGTEHVNGALVVPLLTAAGCIGVLAVELQRCSDQTASVLPLATILAALLAQMTLHAVRESELVAAAQ